MWYLYLVEITYGGQELQFLRVFVVVGLVAIPGVSVAQSARDTLF